MRVSWKSAADIQAGVWQWPHIDPAKEWADKLTGEIVVETFFMDRLEALRAAYGRPMFYTSCYRTPEHNRSVSATSSSDGAHTLALAADVSVYGAHAVELIGHALALGFTGIGVSQKGDPAKRFIHLDMAPSRDGAPRPTIWSY